VAAHDPVHTATDLVGKHPFEPRPEIHDPAFIEKKGEAFRGGCSPQFVLENGQIPLEERAIPVSNQHGGTIRIVVGERKSVRPKPDRIGRDQQRRRPAGDWFGIEVPDDNVLGPVADGFIDEGYPPTIALGGPRSVVAVNGQKIYRAPESGVEPVGSFPDLIPDTDQRHAG
jgi:hypothetical protein